MFEQLKRMLSAVARTAQLFVANCVLTVAMVVGRKDIVRQNLQRPSNSLLGRLTQRLMEVKNKGVEVTAVELCKIESNYNVLEVGFGPGIGLSESLDRVKNGSGKVFGLDLSPDMIMNAEEKFQQAISAGKLEVNLGDVMHLPYRSCFFDRVYHSNCYYFWEDPLVAAAELLRVLKPSGLMVTTLNVDSVKFAAKQAVLTGLTDPQEYRNVLIAAGFKNVTFEHIVGETHAVIAHASDK